ncbi:MAG: twin-arginine translocase subunit TatC, partial [Deltaproteobacteria bacterium CG_4_10_14_3_um_filter_60_8]
MTEEKVSTIVEHLAELRKRLIISIIAVMVGMGVAWNFANDILAFMERPLTGRTYLTEVKKDVYAMIKERAPAVYAHFKLDQDDSVPEKTRLLNYSAPLEPFFMQCKISMLAGFVLALPVVFYQLWLFIAPGLTRRERRLVVPFVTSGTVTFCLGAMFFLTIIWP